MPKGLSEVIYRNRQAMQWPNEKRQNDKQWATKKLHRKED
jgi:hypothetical protein